MGILDKPGDTIDRFGNQADKFIATDEEREGWISERHEVDMKSDNWLSKSVRPITLLWLMAILTAIVVLEATIKATIPTDTKIMIGGLTVSVIGFYFDSKKQERIAEKNAEGNLKLQKMRFRQERKERRKDKD